MKKIFTTSCLLVSTLFFYGCWPFKKKKNIESSDSMTLSSQENINDNNDNDDTETVVEFVKEDDAESTDAAVITIFDESDEEFSKDSMPDSIKIVVDDKANAVSAFESNIDDDMFVEKKKMHLGTLLFDFDMFREINNKYKKHLHEIVEKIKVGLSQNKNIHVIIEGHACNSAGSEKYNLWISDERAKAIKECIINDLGEAADNLSLATFGCGTSHLIVEGSREEQNPNRRVEVYIIANK